jgi:hypothetical protein
MTDFDSEQMKRLAGHHNVTVVYLQVDGDYWINQSEFCNAFRNAPLSDHVVIHVRFEGLSLSAAGVVSAVEKILTETGRLANSVFIFSPNALSTDAPWENLFWKEFIISDEFSRCQAYWHDADIHLESVWKPWALFVGRQTTPRLLALYDIWHDPALKQACLLSKMNETAPPTLQPFDHSHMIHDQLCDWMPIVDPDEKISAHEHFRNFCSDIPVGSIDGYSVIDQYTNAACGENRNAAPTKNLINISGKYLFEITFETMTRGTTFTPSEKTIRTIVAQKPIVAYAPKNFLQQMQLLGFKTFDNLWDESYDQLEGPERYQKIINIVQQVTGMSVNQQLELYQESRQICTHNKQRLIALTMK